MSPNQFQYYNSKPDLENLKKPCFVSITNPIKQAIHLLIHLTTIHHIHNIVGTILVTLAAKQSFIGMVRGCRKVGKE